MSKAKYWDTHTQLNLHLDNDTFDVLLAESLENERTLSYVARKYLKIGLAVEGIEKEEK